MGALWSAVSLMGRLSSSLYFGEMFDKNTAAVVPGDAVDLPAIWCFCSASEFSQSVRELDQTVKVTNATLAKVPFDLDRWSAVARQKYPNGLPSPTPTTPLSGSSTATPAAPWSGTRNRNRLPTVRLGQAPPCSKSRWRGCSATAGRRNEPGDAPGGGVESMGRAVPGTRRLRRRGRASCASRPQPASCRRPTGCGAFSRPPAARSGLRRRSRNSWPRPRTAGKPPSP